MDMIWPQGAISEEELNRHESGINRVAWSGGIAVALVTAILLIFLITTQAAESWEYPVFISLAGVPLGYALFSNLIIRRMQLSLLERYKAQLVMKMSQLEELASRDELTGLYNRRYFYQAIQNELGKARASHEPLALLVLDLDGLKSINDEHGHGVGDVIIANLGKVIMKHTRNSDVPARLGGDEFGVIMPATDKRGAFALARRLWEELEQTPMYERGDRYLMVTVSIGLSGYPWGGEDLDELMQWADADMYANKVSRKLPAQPPQVDAMAEAEALPEDLTTSI